MRGVVLVHRECSAFRSGKNDAGGCFAKIIGTRDDRSEMASESVAKAFPGIKFVRRLARWQFICDHDDRPQFHSLRSQRHVRDWGRRRCVPSIDVIDNKRAIAV